MLTEKDIEAFDAWYYDADMPQCVEYCGVPYARLQWMYSDVPMTELSTVGYTNEKEPGEVAAASPEAEKRKGQPVCTGVLDYFPDALLAVAEVSKLGNDQHNPGEPLHWARGKSMDQMDAAVRHIIDRKKSKFDTDGGRHLAKAAWRILAELQLDIEAEATSGDRAGFLGGLK